VAAGHASNEIHDLAERHAAGSGTRRWVILRTRGTRSTAEAGATATRAGGPKKRCSTRRWRSTLRSYETVINLISNTTNRGGLVVRARLDRRRYPTGKKVSATALRALNIERDAFHGDGNCVIRPSKKR
jgi:hypothetical protein